MLHLSCLGGSAHAMNCCLQHDIDLSVLNNKHETPLDIAKNVGKSIYMQKASMYTDF